MATLDETTLNFSIPLPRFDRRTWHEQYYAGMQIIDAVLQKYIAFRNVVGVWNNSTVYSIGQVVVDTVSGNLFECLLDHTSSATPTTFAAERAANPLLWKNATLAERSRGAWVTATAYSIGDFVVSDEIYAVCSVAHTSGATFAGDSDNWEYLLDASGLQASVNAAEASASAALTSEGNASGHADDAEAAQTAAETAQAASEAASKLTSNSQSTAYTLVITDANKIVRLTGSTARIFTIPPNADVAFPVGTQVAFQQDGTGQLSIAAGSGVTIKAQYGWLKLATQYSMATAVKVGTNEWLLSGGLTE